MRKRRKLITNEEFQQKMKEIQPNFIIYGTFVNYSTYVEYLCLKCGYKHKARTDHLLDGHGCPICNKSGKIPHEEFVKRVLSKNKNVKILSKYETGSTMIKCECSVCGNKWETKGKNLLRGHGCPKCNLSNPKLSTTEYISQMKNINPDIEITGEYTGNGNRVNCKCRICNYEWTPFASAIKSGHGCPNCKAIKDRLTHEEFVERCNETNPNFEILGTYITHTTPIEVKCKQCGDIINTLAGYVIRGCNVCRKCYIQSLYKTNDEFLQEIKSTRTDIIPLEEYKGAYTKIKFQCTKCNHIWKTTPVQILSGCGCPKLHQSRGEKKIAFILDKFNIDYEEQKRFSDLKSSSGRHLSYDFYIPSLNLLIEYQGKQHKVPIEHFGGVDNFTKQQTRDKLKKDYANSHNIELLEIWYNEDIEEKLTKSLNLETLETTGS